MLKALLVLLLVTPTWAAPSSEASSQAMLRLKQATLKVPHGSGFLAKGKSGKTYLITNFHVCLPARQVGKMHGSTHEGEHFGGKVVLIDPVADLCASEVRDSDLALRIAPALTKSETVCYRGYPQGILTTDCGNVIRESSWTYPYPIDIIGSCPEGFKPLRDVNGVLVACSVTYTNYIATFYVAPGASGSPVVNKDGELVGVVESHNGKSDYAGLVPYPDLVKFLEKL